MPDKAKEDIFPPIAAGEFLIVQCPDNSLPTVKAGDYLPKEQPLFYVAKIESSTVHLGPLAAGKIKGQLKCTNDNQVEIKAEIQVNPNSAKKLQPPLGIIDFAYPLWVFLAIAAAISIPILTYITLKICKKLRQKYRLLKNADVKTLSPDQKLKQSLSKMKTTSLDSNPQIIKALYNECNDHLRLFIEERLHLSSPFATSNEFMAKIKYKIKSDNLRLSEETLTALHSYFSQSDEIRFSKKELTKEIHLYIVKNLEHCFSDIKRMFPLQQEVRKK